MLEDFVCEILCRGWGFPSLLMSLSHSVYPFLNMRQVRLVPSHPIPGRLFSGISKYRDLTVNFVIFSGSLWLLSSPRLLGGLHRFSELLEQRLVNGHLGRLPGFLIFAAIAATVFFVQEIEKRRQRKP